MLQTLQSSSRYKKFTQDRNQVLEKININCQSDVTTLLYEMLDHVTGYVSHCAIQKETTLHHLKFLNHQLGAYLDHQIEPLIPKIEARIKRMRSATFIITYLAELEAVARATKRTNRMTQFEFRTKLKNQIDRKTLTGQTLSHRIYAALLGLKFKIIKEFQAGVIQEETPKEIVDRVKASYPKLISFKRPPRALKPIRESARNPEDEDEKEEFDFYGGLVTDDEWNLATQAYIDTELPPTRTGAIDYTDDGWRADWEIERDMTDDFVQQVRDGQIQAAQDLGVKDFVWVSIIDKKTCEVCCLPRNGKTTSEIREMLASGELDKDECDAVVPPAHCSCRCDLAPVSNVDEVEGPDWATFIDWLDS